jgi:hypothetical protein
MNVHYNSAKPQNGVVQNFAPKAVKFYCPYWAQAKKTFLSTSNVIISHFVQSTSLELFCTYSPTSLGQDLTVKIAKKAFFCWFGLLELEWHT